jgi:O-acetyl-ADP-ribose deacetylase (regulator of RNase III)
METKIVRKTEHWDILKEKNAIIVQQVNCKGVMGAGLALQIKNKYPNVERVYLKYIDEVEHGYNKFFARYDSSLLLGRLFEISTGIDGNVVACFFSQDGYGRSQKHTCYRSFELCLQQLTKYVVAIGGEYSNKTVCFPHGIGCGLGGGDWEIIVKHFATKCSFLGYPGL